MAAANRDHRPVHAAGPLQRLERRMVTLPERQPQRRDGVGLLHLRRQKGGDDLPRQV